ncbi:MAG: DUF3775 domain-containing protein [Rhodobacteraceae bacterium]|nr:DUF3775 domain-containing protein [Paracoccaceae bacterium]
MNISVAISADTVRMLIQKVRSVSSSIDDSFEDGHEGEVEFDEDKLAGGHHHDGLAEEKNDDMTSEELKELIDDLNVDESADLIAIAWIGRGDFESSDFDQAAQDAREHPENDRTHYLLGMPLLAEYLETGLDALDL